MMATEEGETDRGGEDGVGDGVHKRNASVENRDEQRNPHVR